MLAAVCPLCGAPLARFKDPRDPRPCTACDYVAPGQRPLRYGLVRLPVLSPPADDDRGDPAGLGGGCAW